jgi:hypothetical protein
VKLRRRPFLQRLRNSYRVWRRVDGFGPLKALRAAWRIARV